MHLILDTPCFYFYFGEMLSNVANNPTFIKCNIMDDERWVYEFDVATVQQFTKRDAKNEPKPQNRNSLMKPKVIPAEFYVRSLKIVTYLD